MKQKRKIIFPIGPSIAYVPLTRGQYSTIEVDDAPFVGRDNWYAMWDASGQQFYAVRLFTKEGKKGLLRLHRELLGIDDSLIVDHINTYSLDNRRLGNLRGATHSQNCANRGKNVNNTSGFKGAYWHKSTGRWFSKIQHEGKVICLGYFKTAESAHDAYCEAAVRLLGAFSRTA